MFVVRESSTFQSPVKQKKLFHDNVIRVHRLNDAGAWAGAAISPVLLAKRKVTGLKSLPLRQTFSFCYLQYVSNN